MARKPAAGSGYRFFEWGQWGQWGHRINRGFPRPHCFFRTVDSVDKPFQSGAAKCSASPGLLSGASIAVICSAKNALPQRRPARGWVLTQAGGAKFPNTLMGSPQVAPLLATVGVIGQDRRWRAGCGSTWRAQCPAIVPCNQRIGPCRAAGSHIPTARDTRPGNQSRCTLQPGMYRPE